MSGFMRLQVWSEPAERLDDPDTGDAEATFCYIADNARTLMPARVRELARYIFGAKLLP